MKKTVLLFVMLLMLPVIAICGNISILPTQVGMEYYFGSIVALSAIVLPITEFFKRLFNLEGKWTVTLSWIISIVLAFIGWWLNIGIFENATIMWVVIYGIASAMAANSIFDIQIIQAIIKMLKIKMQ